MKKYVRVSDGLTSNEGGFNYKLNEINETSLWHPNENDPKLVGGFNYTTEDKVLRWLHRGDTLYDVEIPPNAETKIINEEKGIYRTNKIIIKNPIPITDNLIIELYNKNDLPNKVLYQCLVTLLYRKHLNIVKKIIKDKINKDNVSEAIEEFENHLSHDGKQFNYDELWPDAKEVYDILLKIRG